MPKHKDSKGIDGSEGSPVSVLKDTDHLENTKTSSKV